MTNWHRVFLDMDGVLADFVGAIHRAHGRPNCYDDPANHGKFDIDKIWGVTPKEFWVTDTFEFWNTIEKTAEADALVKWAIERVGGVQHVAILTSPSNGPGCVPGKHAWVRRHFPQLARQIIYTGFKEAVARPDALLVDDKDSNVRKWRQADGSAILLPRPWNSAHAVSDKPLACFNYL